MSKFKVGDKVKLLPSIVTRCVLDSEIGKIGVVTDITGLGSIQVKTNFKYCNSMWAGWILQECDVAPAIIKGQQLLFSFMND